MTAADVMALCEEARLAMRTDLVRAGELAETALAAARKLGDRAARAEALRMKGHVAYSVGQYRKAMAAYRPAVRLLEQLGQTVDAGRTRSSALQSLIYLGRYEEALAWAVEARRVFAACGDGLRLARLDSNEANILHRQDRHDEALAQYQRAAEGLRQYGDLDSLAITVRNLAVCHAARYELKEALACYEEAARLYRERNLKLLAAEVGDNIAQLHHLRGDYIVALETYRASNVDGRANTFHAAVARLDQSELLCELNLFSEAADLAEAAIDRFQRLGVHYERGKALLTLAAAVFRLGESHRALRLLRDAEKLFRREANPGWLAVAGLYRATMLLDLGDPAGARLAAESVLERLEGAQHMAALLLLTRIAIREERLVEARAYLEWAETASQKAATLPVRYQVAMVAAEFREAREEPAAAWAHYQRAHEILEVLRGQFGGDGLRISFLEDKSGCYEALAGMALRGAVDCPLEQAFLYIQQAKSRSLADGMLQEDSAEEPEETRARRGALSWCYRELERADTPSLRARIEGLERQLTAEWALRYGYGGRAGISVAQVQACLAPGESLVEYFAAKGWLYAFVLTRNSLCAKRVAPWADVEHTCHLLRFQISRGLWAGEHPGGRTWLAATEHHLRQLYRLLVEPLEAELTGGHWTFAPHGVLHQVPFPALLSAEGHLIERRTISYAPSALVHQLCQHRPLGGGAGVALFSVPDAQAPEIASEARELAGILDPAEVFAEEAASLQNWTQAMGRRRVVHLATHGLFRQDNPLFSSVRLHDGRFCLYDLSSMRVEADLVTLSGCATGMLETTGAGEVMGLARGLLTAGARAAHLSLWDVNDGSTACYMAHFYRSLRAGSTVAAAGRTAMLATRERSPHPYYWSAFFLTGQVRNSIGPLFSGAPADPNGIALP